MAKTILVAEDSPTVLMILKSTLISEGYEVVTSGDGMEALSLARKIKPDLVILDCMLPKMDGFNICRMLKFDKNFKDIPIFIFTARTSDTDKQISEKTGADEYVPKSASMEEIDTLIEKVNLYLK